MSVIYIAGAIRNDPGYVSKFSAAEAYLRWKGWTILNPAELPDDLEPRRYMPVCLAMVEAADAVCRLNDAITPSPGADLEVAYARYQKKTVYMGVENVPDISEKEV